jgi:hypothetical protein
MGHADNKDPLRKGGRTIAVKRINNEYNPNEK